MVVADLTEMVCLTQGIEMLSLGSFKIGAILLVIRPATIVVNVMMLCAGCDGWSSHIY